MITAGTLHNISNDVKVSDTWEISCNWDCSRPYCYLKKPNHRWAWRHVTSGYVKWCFLSTASDTAGDFCCFIHISNHKNNSNWVCQLHTQWAILENFDLLLLFWLLHLPWWVTLLRLLPEMLLDAIFAIYVNTRILPAPSRLKWWLFSSGGWLERTVFGKSFLLDLSQIFPLT